MSLEDAAIGVAVRLKRAGHSTFLVGGCVRDYLLGLSPKDYDVATAATPAEVMALFSQSHAVGALFGVVLVSCEQFTIEVATFRSDHDYRDGRRPEQVVFERDAARDVLRRDFTINALLMDPDTREVIDYVGGRDDLSQRLIRAIGNADERFREDHLRLLRAVRFAARFQFEIEQSTSGAIARHKALLAHTSKERVRDELSRMLTGLHPERAFELLRQTGLLGEVLPEVAALEGVEQPPEYHPEGDVWVHTLLMLKGLDTPSTTLAWGVLLHDIGKPNTFERAGGRIRFHGHVEEGVRIARNLLGRLRFSNDDVAQILALIAGHMKFKDIPQMRESTVKRFLRQERMDEHLELHRLDCLSSNGNLENYARASEKLNSLAPEQLRPPRLITGRDLIEAGYPPGPAFQEALHAAEEAQLNGEITSAEQAMRVAQAVLDAVPGQ